MRPKLPERHFLYVLCFCADQLPGLLPHFAPLTFCFLINIIFGLLQKDSVNQVVEKRSGRFPLHIAADFGQLDVMQYLIDNGADINVRASSPVRLLGVTLIGNWSYFSSNGLGSGKIWLSVFLNSIRVFLVSAFSHHLFSEGHFPKALANLCVDYSSIETIFMYPSQHIRPGKASHLL